MVNFKKLIAAGAIASLILANPVSAFAAAEADASVADDGNAYSYTDDSDNLKVDNDQAGLVANFDLGIGVSGANTQDYNDDENGMETGDSDGFGGSDNFLNSNVTSIEEYEEGASTSEAVVGEDGNATAYAYDNDEVKVYNDNRGLLENLTLGLAVSGYNSQSGNDDGNSIDTGDSDAAAFALNEVNNNWTSIDGGNSAHAFASVGDDGNAYTYAEDNDYVKVRNNNSAAVHNASLAFAVSGANTQSGNDDDNELNTGSSSAQSGAANFVNNNVTVVGGEEGGSATASSEVGEDGDATSYAYDNDEVKVYNDNEAEVVNVSVAAGVSGGNTQSDNDDGNTMTTGSSSGNSCSTNTVNSNWTVIGGSLPEGEEAGCN